MTFTIGLSSNTNKYAEQCFEQTYELIYHASNLEAGAHYALKVVFYGMIYCLHA